MGIKQYQVVLANLNPTVGSEIKKTRPCLVISPDEMNQNLKTIIVAPMTTKSRPYPTRIEVFHGGKQGWVVLDQIRTIDKSRIINIFESIKDEEIKKIKAIIKELLVD